MWDKVGAKNWRRPLLLQPDNFTSPTRTPWGGRRIVDGLKAASNIEVEGPVGEAWELSVEPDFPSRLAEGPTLDEVLRSDPSLLGREAAAGSTALLIKLVDAADDLSLQIHPGEDDPALGPDESGKPEAWYIIDAEAGSGLYLGFRDGVSRDDVRRELQSGGRIDKLMSFVPVSVGDLFLIEPGTPHAIGKGILLLEPQRVTPGKRGITYRYWDWDRRYDASGQPDDAGKPRALHAERALQVTNWTGPRGDPFLDRIRHQAGAPAMHGSAVLERLASPNGPLRSTRFLISRLAGTGDVELPPEDTLAGLTVLAGRVTLGDGDGVVELAAGQTAALPANLGAVPVTLQHAHAIVCALA